MQLRPKEIQESPNERMGRQRETSFDVGQEEKPFSLPWLGLDLVSREPPRIVREHAVLDEFEEILLPHSGSEEIPLDPARWHSLLLRLDDALLLRLLQLAGLSLRHGGSNEIDCFGLRWWPKSRKDRREEEDDAVPNPSAQCFYNQPTGPLASGPSTYPFAGHREIRGGDRGARIEATRST